jgi:hypothetical protein
MGSLAFAILSAMLIIGVSPKAINFCTVLQSKIFRMNIIANSIPNSLIEVINKNMFILNATSYLIQNVPHSSQRSN